MRPGTPAGSSYLDPEFRRIRTLLRDANARVAKLEAERKHTPEEHLRFAWLHGLVCGLAFGLLAVVGVIAWQLVSSS